MVALFRWMAALLLTKDIRKQLEYVHMHICVFGEGVFCDHACMHTNSFFTGGMLDGSVVAIKRH